jgi:hypothetical protein
MVAVSATMLIYAVSVESVSNAYRGTFPDLVALISQRLLPALSRWCPDGHVKAICMLGLEGTSISKGLGGRATVLID